MNVKWWKSGSCRTTKARCRDEVLHLHQRMFQTSPSVPFSQSVLFWLLRGRLLRECVKLISLWFVGVGVGVARQSLNRINLEEFLHWFSDFKRFNEYSLSCRHHFPKKFSWGHEKKNTNFKKDRIRIRHTKKSVR